MLFRSVENSIVADTLPQHRDRLAGLGSEQIRRGPAKRYLPRLRRNCRRVENAFTHARLASELRKFRHFQPVPKAHLHAPVQAHDVHVDRDHLSCLLLGYPIAYLLANLPLRTSNLLMILVLLPFWTSLLVRTSRGRCCCSRKGVINDFSSGSGWSADDQPAGDDQQPDRHDHRDDAYPAALHDPAALFGDEDHPPSYVRAAKASAPTDWTAFWRVYFPQSVPGIGAGAILVFILSIGYYITPELVGGAPASSSPTGSPTTSRRRLNWGLAAALGSMLLALVLVLYWSTTRSSASTT
jgi:hypothetical protein